MAIVYGQIESLRRIRETLRKQGIARFNSIGDIDEFRKNYEREKQEIHNSAIRDLANEINGLKADEGRIQSRCDEIVKEITTTNSREIDRLKRRHESLQQRKSTNALINFYQWVRCSFLAIRIATRERNISKEVTQRTDALKRRLNEIKKQLVQYEGNSDQVISLRCSTKLSELAHIKEVIDGLNPLIAGAIGENLVDKELRKLSDEYILFNDFSAEFNPPIYNRKEADKIFSIQIDHLLVTKAGVWVIETKNWSTHSVQNLDLRSPVEQVKRTNFALYVLLNNSALSRRQLNRHHWGQKEIPVRNLIVMINHKPKEKFQYVQVKKLNELNRYITHFDPIFDNSEVYRISEYLKNF
jgi:hypothetical protein